VLAFVCFIGGIVFGVILTWALERRRYEAIVKDLEEIEGAVLVALDEIINILEVMVKNKSAAQQGGSEQEGKPSNG